MCFKHKGWVRARARAKWLGIYEHIKQQYPL